MAKVKEKQVVRQLKKPLMRPTFIKQWRNYRDLTQERVAARIGMSSGNLSNIETGKQGYTQETLERLADALQCEVVDLLIRDPSAEDGIWTLWERAKPAEREQIVKVARALVSKIAS